MSQRKEWREPKEQILKLTSRGRDLRNTEREDFRGATQEVMLPERSTMNTTSGFALFGRLNLGTRVTMRAVELGIVGCDSSSAAGEERLAHLMRRTKSLPSSVVVWPSVTNACCGLKAASGVSVECPPRYKEIGCDGDWGRRDLSDYKGFNAC